MQDDLQFVGIDVDAQHLVCCRLLHGRKRTKTFTNDPEGHSRLLAWLTPAQRSTRVCMEATGVYSYLVAATLSEQDEIVVSVVNPRVIKSFTAARLQRGKTDAMDADSILEYLLCMPFESWTPLEAKLIEIQLLSRRVLQLTTETRREKNRLHAALRMGEVGRYVANDIEVNIRHLKRRTQVIEQHLVKLISEVEFLQQRMDQLISVTGIAEKSGARLLAELVSLPSDMTSKEWVAYAGLDPRPCESRSLTKPRRISKQGNRYLRDALYMPALVAIRYDEHVRAYKEHLVQAGKKPKQAITAVMRKLLVAIWGMFKNEECWDSTKFYKMS